MRAVCLKNRFFPYQPTTNSKYRINTIYAKKQYPKKGFCLNTKPQQQKTNNKSNRYTPYITSETACSTPRIEI
jgi:hypothetical protein